MLGFDESREADMCSHALWPASNMSVCQALARDTRDAAGPSLSNRHYRGPRLLLYLYYPALQIHQNYIGRCITAECRGWHVQRPGAGSALQLHLLLRNSGWSELGSLHRRRVPAVP